MISKKFLAIAAIAALATVPAANAQDDGFDLNSQRGEIQEYRSVDGHKVDHGGLVINPTPQSIERPNNGVLNISGGFRVDDPSHKFGRDLGFLDHSRDGLPLKIVFGEKASKKAGVKQVDGAYKLDIGPKDVTITGYNERGAFYGIQTLRQILESDLAREEGGLPMMVVNDYPAMKYRGVVEGFYGTPWSHAVRLSLIDFYGKNKLSDYLYGPKDDPYHSTPNWRLPYPADQARRIQNLVEASKRARVNFIWAIHPGQDIKWDEEDYQNLLRKFNMMYDLGVRSFAIFFDDIDGIGTDPHRQVALLNRLTDEFVKAKGDVTNLIVCPTDYSQLWAKPGPEGPLAVYGRELNPDVEVFWTGVVVCSDLTPETLEFVDSRIKRPALYWWNYPVTDYCRNYLLQGPVYGLDTSLTSEQVIGFESNPMEHGEASKLALYGVADYAWNPRAYNPLDNWERGLQYMMPDAAEAYRTFAIHSADTETGYRRDESWETTVFPYNHYTQAQFDSLKAEFEKVTKAEKQIYDGCTNRGLYIEIQPWLQQLTKVGQRGLKALDLIKTYEAGVDSTFWNAFLDAQMSEADKAAYEAHKVGTMKLHPFYENAMNDMVSDFYERIAGDQPKLYRGIGSYPNLRTNLSKLMLDSDTTTFYTSANSQKEGDWIGIDLLQPRSIDEVVVHQGRNSVDDVDYFDHVRLEYSVDGRKWHALTPDLERTYIIEWQGEPVNARYLRLRRLDSEKTNWASVRSFRVNPPSNERLGLNVTSLDPTAAMKAFDEDPLSVYDLKEGDLCFDRRSGAKTLTVLMNRPTGQVTLTQYDKKGKVVATTPLSGAYDKIDLNPAAARLIITGPAAIHELIQR